MKSSDKVVCIDDKFSGEHMKFWIGVELPKAGVVYVIRCVSVDGFGRTHLHLVGIFGPKNGDTENEWGFHPRRFRKLDDIREENRLRNSDQLTL